MTVTPTPAARRAVQIPKQRTADGTLSVKTVRSRRTRIRRPPVLLEAGEAAGPSDRPPFGISDLRILRAWIRWCYQHDLVRSIVHNFMGVIVSLPRRVIRPIFIVESVPTV